MANGENLNELCDEWIPRPDDGEMILEEVARRQVDNYVNTLSHIPKRERVIAHTFHLSKVEELMRFITQYNAENPDNSITGIRVYRCHLDNRRPQGNDKLDVFFMPVLHDGNDLYTVYKGLELANDGGILGAGRPCPNLCDDKSFL